MAARVRRPRPAASYLLSAGLFAILSMLIVVPVAMVIYTAFRDVTPFSGNGAGHFTTANFASIFSGQVASTTIATLILAFFGTLIATVFGCGLAWLAARTDIPGKPLVHLAGVIPLFISLLVAAVTWSLLGAGRSGYLNIILDSLGLPFHIEMRSYAGIAFVEGIYNAPYPFLLLYGAIMLIHPELEEAAMVHGGTRSRTMSWITLPIVRPAMIGSALLVFVQIVEDFPVPQILGGPVGIQTLSVRLYNMMTRVPNFPNQAAALSIVLTTIVCLLVYGQQLALAGRDYRTVTGKGSQRRMLKLNRWRKPAVAFVAIYAFVAVGLPMLALIEGSLRANLFIADASALFDVSQFSLSHLAEAATSPEVMRGLLNSVIAGLVVAVLGSALFFVLAYVVARSKLPGRHYLEFIVMAPLALPAIVLAMGVLWTWVGVPFPIYGTLAILIFAFAARFAPQGYRAISSTIVQIHDDLENAALVAGATRPQAVTLIVLPLIRSGVFACAFLLFVLTLREVASSLFLYTTQSRVLAIVILETYNNGLWATVASMSLIYTILLIALTLLGRRIMQPAF